MGTLDVPRYILDDLMQYGLAAPQPQGTGVPDTFRCIECTLVRPNSMKHSFQQRDTCTECLINMTSGP